MLDFYNLHEKPESIHKHDEKENIPALFWHRYYDMGDKGERELKNREEYLAKSPEFAYRYAWQILCKRFPKGEAAIAKVPEWAFKYARWVVKKRWPEGEDAKDPRFSYVYAKDVIDERFPKGEAIIAADPKWAYQYAAYVVKGRWPEGEAAINKEPYYKKEYQHWVLKGKI